MGLGLLDTQEILKAVTTLTSLLCGVKPSPTPLPKYSFSWCLWQRFTFPYDVQLHPGCGVCYRDRLKSVSATCTTPAPHPLKPWLCLLCWQGGILVSLFCDYCLELACLTLITILTVHLYPFPLSTFSQDELFLLDSVVTCVYLLYKSVNLPQVLCISAFWWGKKSRTQGYKQPLTPSSPISSISPWKAPPPHFLSSPWLLVPQGHLHNPELSLFPVQSA